MAPIKVLLDALRTWASNTGEPGAVHPDGCLSGTGLCRLNDPEQDGRSTSCIAISPPISSLAQGEWKLTDFGEAASQQAHRSWVVKGKFSHLSPKLPARRISIAGPVFAVGILLYELLTGKRLFGGSRTTSNGSGCTAGLCAAISPQNRGYRRA